MSAATVRRDLALLEEQRLLARTHGGAVAHGVLYELPLRYRSARHQEEKAAHRSGGGRAGSRRLGDRPDRRHDDHRGRAGAGRPRQLTVVTNSLSIASELAVRPNLKLVVTGGVARTESYELVGPLAESSLASLNLDLVLVGVDGIAVHAGLTTHHEVEAHTNRALIERARQVIVVADSSKIGQVAFARICELDEVDELITDDAADPAQIEAIRAAGVAVTLVEAGAGR